MPTTRGAPGKDDFDLSLRLLDVQIVGSKGELLGNVDNLEMREVDGDLLVTGIMVGPAALGPRLNGRLGRWTVAIWRRLHPASEPTATVLHMSHVVRIGSGIDVSAWGSRALAGTFGFEQWLRHYVIAPIPGATGDSYDSDATGDSKDPDASGDSKDPDASGDSEDPEDSEDSDATGNPGDLGGEPVSAAAAIDRRQMAPAEGSHLVSDLLGREVLGPDGSPVGRVNDLRCEPIERTGLEVGRLRVTGLAYGKRPAGSMLGYGADRHQGPSLVAALIRAWHRDDRHVPIDSVETIDWSSATISLRSDAHPKHPHPDG